MTIVLILNVIGSVGLVVAIVGLLGLNIALGRHSSSTTSSCGREQQMSALPSAGGSTGSGL